MKKRLKYKWPETGTLDIRLNGNESATLRFFPSAAAIKKGLAEARKRPTAKPKPKGQSNPSEK